MLIELLEKVTTAVRITDKIANATTNSINVTPCCLRAMFLNILIIHSIIRERKYGFSTPGDSYIYSLLVHSKISNINAG